MAAEATSDTSWTVRRLATHGTEVHAVVGAELRAEPVAVTAGDDGQVRFWSLTTGELRLAFQAGPPDQTETPYAYTLAVLDDTLYTGWGDGSVATFDLATGTERDRVRFHHEGSWVSSLEPFAADGRRWLLSAATDGAVVLMEAMADDGLSLASYVRSDGMPVWSLAVIGGARSTEVYAGVGEGEIQHWTLTGPSSTLDDPIPGAWWSKRSPIRLASVRGGLVASDVENLVFLDPEAAAVLDRLDAGVGEITALHVLSDWTAVAVGGQRGLGALAAYEGSRPPPVVHFVELGLRISALGSLGDLVIVGDEDGGVHVAGPASAVAPTEPLVSDRVELQDDVPGETTADDRLRRSPLAEALAVRLERRHEEGREKSFLVHLDGPWGSGKTTVLNFVAGQLGDGWTIVRYNAWRQSRVGPPWWTLLTGLRTEMLRRRRWVGRVSLWFREMLQQRIARASGLPATLLILLAAMGVFLLWDVEAADTLTTVQGVAAALTAVATLFVGAQFVAGFFGWHSARGAKAFQDLDANPMDRVAAHFSWLVEQEGRPIAYFVDDLDRCPAGDVVELLEAVQTLVRDAGDRHHDDGVLSPCFVVAGDGAWIRQAFEDYYSEFADEIAEPGRPLGYLFLAKIFQLTMPVPRIGPVRQAEFFRELLGLGDPDPDPAATAAVVDEARRQVATAPNDDAQQQVLADLPQAVREVVAPTAVRRQTEPVFASATEHRLSGFAGLLPDNPRAVKRFLNAFALTRSVRTVEGQAIPTACLALWTILQTRWPLLADALTAHPEWVDPESAEKAQVPADVQALLDAPDVREVLAFADGGPLTPDLVRACRGG